VVNRQAPATNAAAAVQLAGATATDTRVRIIDSTTNVVSGPAMTDLGAVQTGNLQLNGYSLALMEFDSGGAIVAPSVTSVAPSSGPPTGGTSVTITGSGFTGTTAVAFGGTAAASFQVDSDTQITATSPPEAPGTVDIVVTAPGGTSSTSSADRFSYVVGPAPPVVTSVVPTDGPTTGGTSVTINGSGFTGATSVTFGANAATNVVVVNDSTLTATSPAGTGTVDITVTAPGGTSAATILDRFAYTPFPGKYQPVTPYRILDTRFGPGLQQKLQQNETRTIAIAGQPGSPVPAMNSATPPAAVVMNVTVTNPTAASYLTLFPTGVTRPTASNLNFTPGQTVPNLVEVALGPDGNVNVYNHAASTDVIFDIEGWVSTQNTVTGTAGLFRALTPYRVLDTRTSSRLFQGDANTITLQVAGTGGAGGVPANASSVVMNVTVTNPTAASYLTVYPSGASRPTASNLNFTPGQTVPNRVQVKLGTGGTLKLYNNLGYVDVVIDVNGWFTDGSDPAATGGAFTGVTPYRVLDTRYGPGQRPPLGTNQSMQLMIAGQGGVPAMTAGVPPTAVVLNVTVTDTTGPSYLTVYPGDAAWPGTSDLNWVPGETVPNLVVVRLGRSGTSAAGTINIYNHIGSTSVVVDIVGWYQ